MLKGPMSVDNLGELTAINLQQVDFADRSFALTPDWFPVASLVDAIRRVGLRCPPSLQIVAGDRYRIISGFRRLRAASSVGLDVVPGFVRSGDPVQLFVDALVENASTRPLHLLEKATAVWKLTQLFSIPQAKVISEFLPLLGTKPNRFEMNRLLELAMLPLRIQQALVLLGLTPETAVGLGRWPNEEQTAFLDAFSRLQPGFNHQKELFLLLDEVRVRDGRSAVELLSNATGLDDLLGELRSRRFPRVAEYEQRYRQLKAGLRLPRDIQFNIPPFFEGDKIQIGFAFRNPGELKAVAAKLGEVAEKPELAEIFGLL